jgi:RNA polymerase sigma-70 factor (ECF subfamily)
MEISADNKEKLNEIYEKYHRLVMWIVYGILGDQNLAEEAFQTTFYSVAKNVHKFDDDSKIKSYVSATAHNTALKYLKKHQIITRNEVSFPDDENNAEGRIRYSEKSLIVDNVEDEVIKRLEKEKLHKLLKQLDDKKSVYIYEFYFDKLTIKEIAEKHNIKENTAKKRIYRSVENLRKLYFEMEGI